MEYFWGQFVLTVLPILGALRLVLSCYQSPWCEQASNNNLKIAVQQGNRTAVCLVLPVYMNCLEEALKMCQRELPQDLVERSVSTGTNVTKLQASLYDSKIRYSDSCDTSKYKYSNSVKGDNSGRHSYRVVSLVGLIIFSCIHSLI